MGKCRLSRLWRCQSSRNTSGTCNDNEQPSTSGVSSAFDSLDCLQKMDLRDLCDRIFRILQNIEDAEQGNVEHTLQSTEKEFWQQRLACLPNLQELFKQGKPNQSVLESYFPKGESDTSTLVYIIFRDVPGHLRLAVGLLSVGASLTNWANIDHRMKEECLNVFQQLCILSKYLCELRNPLIENVKLQQFIVKDTELLVEGSVMCCIHVNNSYLKSYYLQGCSYRECLKWLLKRVKSTNKALRSWSDSFIFEGVRSSPLPGRPFLDYPHHAVGIERQKQEIIRLLEWNSQRNTVAVIVSGPPGIGKTTVADAVFTSLHIPLCNYLCYTGFELRARDPRGSVHKTNWFRYVGKEEKKETADNIEAHSDDSDYYEESEAGNSENEENERINYIPEEITQENPENIQENIYDSEVEYERSEAGDNENEDEDEEQYSQSAEKQNKDYYYDGNGNERDLVFFESKANAGGRCTEVCDFIYFDNDRDDLYDRLTDFMGAHNGGKRRIIVTTRDVECAWEECKKVLNEDCMYIYIMLAAVEEETFSMEKEIVTTRSRKTMKELKEIARSSMGHRAWQMMLLEAATATAADQDNPSSTSFHSHYHAHDDDDDVPEMVKNMIKFCEDIPERLLVIGKYIAAAAAQQCSRSTLQQLLNVSCDEDDDDMKWQKIINLFVTQDFLAQEYMDALQLLCYFRYYCFCSWQHVGYLVYLYELASWESLACLTKDVVEEHTLNILQKKGMLLPDGRCGLRIPFPLWRYFIITKLNKNCIFMDADNDEELGGLQEKLTQRAAAEQQDDEQIKALVINTGEDMFESNVLLLPQVVAKNLQLMWGPNVNVSGVTGEITTFDKLIVQAGRSRSKLAMHMAPSIRYMILRLKDKDCHQVNWQQIPQGLRYLQLEAIYESREESGCAWESIAWESIGWESIARLSNLRALTLFFRCTNGEMKVPAEFCSAAAVSNNIRELYIECTTLEELPDNFWQLRCLHILRLVTGMLRRLPQGFGMLSSLRELSFDTCPRMEELCSDFCNLGSLHTMCWVWNSDLPEKCWKEMVKLKRLTTLVLDSRLYDQSKTLPFPPRVNIYYYNTD